MSNAWSMAFKKRMMELQYAIRDPETLKIYIGDFENIHSRIFDRMNEDRYDKGLAKIPYPEFSSFDKWEGRGYVRKDTGEFMKADDAVKWASQDEKKLWKGESLDLRSKQRFIASSGSSNV